MSDPIRELWKEVTDNGIALASLQSFTLNFQPDISNPDTEPWILFNAPLTNLIYAIDTKNTVFSTDLKSNTRGGAYIMLDHIPAPWIAEIIIEELQERMLTQPLG